MKILKVLFLTSIMFVISCKWLFNYNHNHYVEIINKSEHNITWVIMVAEQGSNSTKTSKKIGH